MSEVSNHKYESTLTDFPFVTEQIKVSRNSIKARLNIVSGMEGDFHVFLIPSINASGYGKSKKEAQEMLELDVQLFLESLHKLSLSKKHSELIKLGWKQEKIAQKNFSKAFVDSDGMLHNLTNTEVSALEVA